MVVQLLTVLFLILCFLLVGIILIQKGKSSLGVGYLGGGAQMLFGGSAGQDIFQKITWAFTILFMAGSLCISILKTKDHTYLLPVHTQQ